MIEHRFELPWAPSMNHYWRSMRSGKLAGLVLLSSEGRAYRARVAEIALERGLSKARLGGSLEIDILAFPPDRRARDLDNLLKPTLDAIKHAGIIEDDVFLDDVRIRRRAVVRGGLLDVTLREVAARVEQAELGIA